jgi:hypothetical protein
MPTAVKTAILIRCAKVGAMYALALGAVMLFWAMSDSNYWAGGFVPLHYRLLVGLWQASGPFAWAILGSLDQLRILVIFAAVWAIWLTIVLITRLRDLPYSFHLLMALVWCLSGFPPAACVIT